MMGLIYRKIIKPILFCFPAEYIHNMFLKMGRSLGGNSFFRKLTKKIFRYKNDILNQDIFGMDFKNPIGLAAGFDYDADLIEIIPSVGFGFHTIGTVTKLPYEGNPSPMLGRLPKSKSLLVNKGFKNAGIDTVLKKVRKSKKKIPLGISIGGTNKVFNDIDQMSEDIVSTFLRVKEENNFDYFELNISCPNLVNNEFILNGIDTKEGLEVLLSKLDKIGINRPLFIKMYLEKNEEETISLCEVASRYKWVSGFIFSNLAKDRSNPLFDKDEIEKAPKGNFSGKPTEKLSNDLISAVYKKYKDRFIIIGCGGIFTGEDAYEKIKRGATLVQIITGMIYEGPSVIGEINKELVKLLEKDGYKNISEAVGSYYK